MSLRPARAGLIFHAAASLPKLPDSSINYH
jgi:hypothetical protein